MVRAVIANVAGKKWRGFVAEEEQGEPWVFGERILSKIIRYRGDIKAFIGDMFKGDPKAWDGLGTRADKAVPGDAYDYLFLLDPAERTLRILDAEDELFQQLSFNERGRSTPVSIDRPPSPWGDIPVVEGWEEALWLGELERVGEVPLNPGVVDALEALLPFEENRIISKLAAEPSYWSVKIGSKTVLYPTHTWRREIGWAQQSPNSIRVWKPLHDEVQLHMGPTELAESLGENSWTSELIMATHFARGGQGELVHTDTPRPARRWTVVTEVRNKEIELKAKGKKQKAGALVQRPVDCAGWQWQVLDWLRWHQLKG